MNLAFDEAQQELRATARAFLAEYSSSDRVRSAMTSELGYEPDVWKRIGAELGWPAVLLPEEHGGLGLGWIELVALLETTGEALLCSPFFATVCLAAATLIEAGSPEQRQRWLPGIAEGETRATLAVCEPGGRWDARGIAAVARRDAAGFVLSGTKRFVPDGHCADLLLVAARAEGSAGEDGVSLFALPAATDGLRVTALPTVDQTRRQAEIALEDVRVGSDALLGQAGTAWPALARALDLAAIGTAAEQVGGAQRCLDLAVAYAKERVQFGRPIGSFQAIKHKCADMLTAVETARSAVYAGACAAAEGVADLAVAASVAKATASDAYFRCAADALQIFGGVGFTWEYDCHLHLKRAKSTETFLGDASHHRDRIARRAL